MTANKLETALYGGSLSAQITTACCNISISIILIFFYTHRSLSVPNKCILDYDTVG